MQQVMIDLWPYIVPALLAVVSWQFRESYILKTKVAIMEKTIEAIQKRIDSHSKKQDDIMTLLTEIKVEMSHQVGAINVSVSSLATDVKNLNNLLAITDVGIKIKREA